MKRIFPLFVIWMLVSCDMDAAVSKPIVYNGDSLVLNTDFTRKSCGNTPKEMPEISGMSCSRVTPGYLWAQSDDNYRVIAMSPKGVIQYDITFNNKPSRGDWEDMCSGVYQGKQTIFVGGFGDNNAKHFKDNYIFYMEEPEIPAEYTKTTYSVGANYIQFQYPDTTRTFDAEAMFYDKQNCIFEKPNSLIFSRLVFQLILNFQSRGTMVVHFWSTLFENFGALYILGYIYAHWLTFFEDFFFPPSCARSRAYANSRSCEAMSFL